MNANDLREKYLKFFESKGHKRLDSFPLVPNESQQLEGKEKVLFTSAGMQPLIPFLTGKTSPPAKRLVDCQKCLRTDDIDEVGDQTHHTFFEMLGNWSIGDLDPKGNSGTESGYWKKEAIEYSFEFLTKELSIPVEKLAVSVFAGDKDVPKDEESAKIWQEAGIPKERIFYLGKEHNWWPTAKREQDSGEFKEPFGPCGPDTEMFVWTGDGDPEGSVDTDDRWVEIWNDVFMQFNRKEDGTLENLPLKCVDTGMGLERALAVLNGKKSAYETNLFAPVIEKLKEVAKDFNEKDARIIADHMKAAVFLAGEGVEPSNKDQGYILRRLIRRAEASGSYGLRVASFPYLAIIDSFVEIYKDTYPILLKNKDKVNSTIEKEISNFHTTLETAFKEFDKIKAKNPEKIPGKEIFYLHTTLGLTFDIIKDIADLEKVELDEKGFQEEFKKHQEVSRGVSAGEFKGGLADHSDITVRGHTATHLLHQALRDVLGEGVHQTGSNITTERIRFDFSYGEKLTAEQIKQVEDIVNSKIKEDLVVKKEMMSQEEADKKGAIGLFKDKYADKVSIYEIGDYSTEYCGGPHVEHTSLVGDFKVIKEESISAGQRRIKAVLE